MRVRRLAMPSIFISYRREDTSGEAGHLAEDLRAQFGGSNVFIDIDAISPGTDFEVRIAHALTECDVTFVLIGDRWLNATLPDGRKRLDEDGDYVRHEIAAALARSDVAVVPVLVEGAKMPTASELPRDIEELSKRNAVELSNKRWAYDVSQLCAVAGRFDGWWLRTLRSLPRSVSRGVPAVAVAAVAAVALVMATKGSGGAKPVPPSRAVLVPATVPAEIDECTSQLLTAVDGTVGPLRCPGGKLNSLAWQYYAKFDPLVMTLGRFATEGQVANTMCSDLKNSSIATVPKETEAYQISALYYGWRFVVPPNLDTMRC